MDLTMSITSKPTKQNGIIQYKIILSNITFTVPPFINSKVLYKISYLFIIHDTNEVKLPQIKNNFETHIIPSRKKPKAFDKENSPNSSRNRNRLSRSTTRPPSLPASTRISGTSIVSYDPNRKISTEKNPGENKIIGMIFLSYVFR